METILNLEDRIGLALQLGESHFREYKSGFQGPPGKRALRIVKDVCTDIAEALVAFANADGGELLVGVEDDGTVTGLDHSPEKLDQMLSAPQNNVHRDTPLSITRATVFEYDSKVVLYFSVAKSTNYIALTSSGRCLQRRDRESVPMSTEHIRFSRTEAVSRQYDRNYVENATLEDLDIGLVEEVANQISTGMSAEKCLQHLELSDYDGTRFRLRMAALLLFAARPSRWHPRLQVRILRIDGTEIKSGKDYNVISDEEVTDNILSLLESSWDLLRPHLTETRFSRDAIFRTQIIYPELACREALTNAIAHRDYSIEGRGIEVRVFSDRLEIASPGGLLSSIDIQDLVQLKGVHQSRNSLVSRVLRETGYMRELGEGMKRIYELMSANDLTPPDLYSDNNVFSITLHHRYIYSQEERLWLENFSEFDLSREQKTIVRLGYNGHVISPKEIWDEVGIVDTDYYRILVESLRSLGILYRSVDRSRVYSITQNQEIPRKSIPQYSIRVPSTSTRSQARRDVADDLEYSRIYVANIPPETDEHDLLNAFNAFGEVVDVYIPMDWDTGHNRGYAFVEFARWSSAEQALEYSGRIRIGNREISTRRARPKSPLRY